MAPEVPAEHLPAFGQQAGAKAAEGAEAVEIRILLCVLGVLCGKDPAGERAGDREVHERDGSHEAGP